MDHLTHSMYIRTVKPSPSKNFGSTGFLYFEPIKMHSYAMLHCDWSIVWKPRASVLSKKLTWPKVKTLANLLLGYI